MALEKATIRENIRHIRERVMLYLRVLKLEENTVHALTERVLLCLFTESREKKVAPAQALDVLLGLLKDNGILPDERFHAIFDTAYKLPLRRTPMAYRPFDPINSQGRPVQQVLVLVLRRLFFFGLVAASTIIAAAAITKILSPLGLTALKWAIIVTFSFLFGWISMNFWTVIFGVVMSLKKNDDPVGIPAQPLPIAKATRIALVMPVHNEEVPRIFAALRAMYESLQEAGALDHFDIFVLSDSWRNEHGISEELFWAKLCQEVDGFGRIFYRRRKLRIHKKSGNVADFCRRWGSRYKYMVTLDADSLMGGGLLVRMVNIMEARPDVGILQTSPVPMNQVSLISRTQQLASHVYGHLLFAGMRFWQMDESGFWGHNAIVRVEPFMKYCALPNIPGNPPFGGHIMSHDFVEAALMRRAGWGVWLAYELEDSYEELPPNLLEELERDRRWCQGNIQHLRLMFMKGISLGHRILFLNGNLFYFSSFMWFLLLVLITVNAVVNFYAKVVYFTPERSLFPHWTVQYGNLSFHLLMATAVFLFVPKILSVIFIIFSRAKAAEFGGVFRLFLSVLLETVFSTLLAPLRMVFHSWYVALNLIGQKLVWKNQARHQKKTSFQEALMAYGLASAGAVAWAGVAFMVSKTLFWWVSPIVIPLVLAIPLAVVFSYPSAGMALYRWGIFLTPVEKAPSKVLVRFQQLYYGKDLCQVQ